MKEQYQRYISKTDPSDIITVVSSFYGPGEEWECEYHDAKGNGLYYITGSEIEKNYDEYNELTEAESQTLKVLCYDNICPAMMKAVKKIDFSLEFFIKEMKTVCTEAVISQDAISEKKTRQAKEYLDKQVTEICQKLLIAHHS